MIEGVGRLPLAGLDRQQQPQLPYHPARFANSLPDGLIHLQPVPDAEYEPTVTDRTVWGVHMQHHIAFIKKGVSTPSVGSPHGGRSQSRRSFSDEKTNMTRIPSLPEFPFVESGALDTDTLGVEMLDRAPVARARTRDGTEIWVALSNDVARQVVTDPRFSRRAAVDPDGRQIGNAVPDLLISMDGEEHAHVRRLFAKAFTPRMVERMRPWIADLVGELLDAMERKGPPLDLVEYVTAPLPVTVICQLLGVPYDDRDQFMEWTDRMLGDTGFTREEIAEGIGNLQRYMQQLVERKRREPGDDLTTELIGVSEQGDRLTEDQLVKNLFLMLGAGHDTTLKQLSNSLLLLLTRREEYVRLVGCPELIPNAVEELLRFLLLSPSGLPVRVAVEDVDLGGQTIRAGETVAVLHHVANRDPGLYTCPNDLDLGRSDAVKHMSFGAGPHFCLGAPLARLELQTALLQLTQRVPTLRLAVPPAEVEWKEGGLQRGPRILPVEW
ncbi:cytochrome P450 [Streptomyces sp. MUM 2J]|uniref:cytochrome P450 n=1 Tax=Streptomyces sp. MUM 2J TaxID=2791987 RepID=UPI001F038F81|nr:cytochrome P450 [Streptomyces sp. MUM 2J]MCH0566876.1 cytochrome P450 [Streptomyces sp. MUM 2J]